MRSTLNANFFGSTNIAYTVDLVLLDKKDKEVKRVPLEGVLTMLDVDG